MQDIKQNWSTMDHTDLYPEAENHVLQMTDALYRTFW